MRPQLAELAPMTIEEFLAFCDGRPDDERWELIEGVAVLNASPVESHQVICLNLGRLLMNAKIEKRARWLPALGVGTRVPASPHSLPQPDVFVKEGPVSDQHITTDALVLFEVLSKSNTPADQAWRKRAYASIPNCQHYVTVATKSVKVVRFDRSADWKGSEFKTLGAVLELPALEVSLPLAEIYRWTPLAGGSA